MNDPSLQGEKPAAPSTGLYDAHAHLVAADTVRYPHNPIPRTPPPPRDPNARGGVVNVRVGPEAGKICHALLERDVCTDYRGDGLRISPHFFNTEDEIDRCFEEGFQIAHVAVLVDREEGGMDAIRKRVPNVPVTAIFQRSQLDALRAQLRGS